MRENALKMVQTIVLWKSLLENLEIALRSLLTFPNVTILNQKAVLKTADDYRLMLFYYKIRSSLKSCT